MPFNPLEYNILHTVVILVFGLLALCLFLQMIVSWLTLMFLPPNHPIVRFFDRLTAPMLTPLRRRIPSMTLGMMDLSYTIAFIFALWIVGTLGYLISGLLPHGW
jgi:uncharacterized protein YggT (Ycf19 family)